MDDEFTVGTFNVKHRRSVNRVHADLARLVSDHCVDVVCLQEMGHSHYPSLRNLPGDWDAYMPPLTTGQPGGRADTPIIYNVETMRHVRSGFRIATSPQKVEYDSNGGGGDVEEKAISWVRLRHRATGMDLVVLNAHAVAGVEAHGRPAPHHPQRVRLFVKMMRTIRRMVRFRTGLGQLVFIGGDFNVDYRADSRVQDHRFPYRALGDHGIISTYQVLGAPRSIGTIGNRLVDYVFFRRSPHIEVLKHRIVALGSDHAAVLATFALHK